MADSNYREIVLNIQKAANIDVPNELYKGMERACLGVERAAKEKAPSASGTLRSSITHKVEGMGTWSPEGVVGTPGIEYAPYVEAGTGIHATMGSRAKQIPWHYCDAAGNWHTTYGMEARPFLKPARDENISAILKCFEGLI